MRPSGLHHVAICVTDEDEALAFYRDALGLVETRRVEHLDAAVAAIRAHGIEVGTIPHLPGAGRQAFLRDPSGNLVELNQPDV